ncbi:hypothetical protein KM043_013344 [Ampulex compressa]|nr:hypothetical protein KM043_013344 [Ampulex compressa]
MYRDPNSSSGSGASTKGDEVELVSRFLAPLCARDETARNIALAAARTTVEGWLGGVGSPNHWDDAGEMEDVESTAGNFKSQDGRYDIERSPTKTAPKNVNPHQQQSLLQDTFRTEGFFPQSVTENPTFFEDNNLDGGEKFPSGSFDCVDGRLGVETGYGTPNERRRYFGDGVESCRSGHSTSSDEGKGFKIEQPQGRCLRFKDGSDARFGSSSESERKYIGSSSNERLNEVSLDEKPPRAKNYVKVKGAKQKQVEDDELDSDTRIYGKSPKFDENLGSSFDRRNLNYRSKTGEYLAHDRRYYGSNEDVSFDETEAILVNNRNREGVVFNTLDGFESENANDGYRQDDNRNEDMNLENFEPVYARDEDALEDCRCARSEQPQDYLRKNEERKFSAGQIKRPLSQDEDVSSKSGRVLESPEVTPGDVGRMLNLGNALDGPRQAQANKYLSLVTLHLPVILRLSVNCPFQNVRIKCAEILEMVKDRGLPVPVSAFDGPSAFVPTSELYPYGKVKRKSGGTTVGFVTRICGHVLVPWTNQRAPARETTNQRVSLPAYLLPPPSPRPPPRVTSQRVSFAGIHSRLRRACGRVYATHVPARVYIHHAGLAAVHCRYRKRGRGHPVRNIYLLEREAEKRLRSIHAYTRKSIVIYPCTTRKVREIRDHCAKPGFPLNWILASQVGVDKRIEKAALKMTRMLLQEPGWKLERKGSALLLRRDSSHLKAARVCFRCDVEVREFERDEDYGMEMEPEAAASPLAMCASCLAALCVTVILPWLLIGG